MRYQPHEYQKRATDFIIRNQACALFLDMGLGKTVATLTAIDKLTNDYLETEKTLVVAPKSVALNTWSAETEKWDHLNHLRLSIVMGTVAQRTKALERDADIYITNRDNIAWLVNQYTTKAWPFDTLVLDESSSFKAANTRRFRALRTIRPQVRRIIELTGTPSPNGLLDLWSQIWLLDRGQRLGKTITSYRSQYFMAGRRNGAVIYEWIPRKGSHQEITERISDICLSMQAADYLEMPDVIDAGMTLALPEKEMRDYREFEREQLMQLDGQDIEAVTAASLTNKLLQFTGGSVYDSDHRYHTVSNAKLEALKDILESTEEPVLVYYQYQSEKDRITADPGLKDRVVCFKGETDILDSWNRGEIRVLLAHPASVAYGLNMQAGGHIIVWFTPTWNLELYQQANARLNRQGQEKPVILYHLIAAGTMDERVMQALHGKHGCQAALLQHIKELRNEHLMLTL